MIFMPQNMTRWHKYFIGKTRISVENKVHNATTHAWFARISR